MKVGDCPECVEHLYSTRHLTEAAASVGISRGLSTQEMLLRYISTYHSRGHVDRIGEALDRLGSDDPGSDSTPGQAAQLSEQA